MIFCGRCVSFIALTVLVGLQKEHLPHRNMPLIPDKSLGTAQHDMSVETLSHAAQLLNKKLHLKRLVIGE